MIRLVLRMELCWKDHRPWDDLHVVSLSPPHPRLLPILQMAVAGMILYQSTNKHSCAVHGRRQSTQCSLPSTFLRCKLAERPSSTCLLHQGLHLAAPRHRTCLCWLAGPLHVTVVAVGMYKTCMHACSSLLLFLPMEALELSLAFSSFLCCDFLLLLSLQDIIQVHGMPQKPPTAC